MMVKVLLYGYATGVFSSRKIGASCMRTWPFGCWAAGNFPRTARSATSAHCTCRSCAVVRAGGQLARECGLVKLGTMAVDGTKIKANASRHKAMSYGRMREAEAELEAQIEALLERAKATDEAEERAGTGHPAEIERREARLAGIGGTRTAGAAPARGGHRSAGAATTTTASRRARTASPRAGATSASSACPRTRPRRTSPTRTAAS